jgi:hypothetical protein
MRDEGDERTEKIRAAFLRYQQRTEDLYEEMIWELSLELGIETNEVRDLIDDIPAL